jgi:hypothetical protein
MHRKNNTSVMPTRRECQVQERRLDSSRKLTIANFAHVVAGPGGVFEPKHVGRFLGCIGIA